jgi:hypothetical protein
VIAVFTHILFVSVLRYVLRLTDFVRPLDIWGSTLVTVQILRFWYSNGLKARCTGRDPRDILVYERKEGRVRNKGSIRNELKRGPSPSRSTEKGLLLRMCKTSPTIDRRECQEGTMNIIESYHSTRFSFVLVRERLRSNPTWGNECPELQLLG